MIFPIEILKKIACAAVPIHHSLVFVPRGYRPCANFALARRGALYRDGGRREGAFSGKGVLIHRVSILYPHKIVPKDAHECPEESPCQKVDFSVRFRACPSAVSRLSNTEHIHSESMTPIRWFAGGIALLLGGVILHAAIVVDDLPDITHEVADDAGNFAEVWGQHTIGQTITPPLPNFSGVALSLRRLPGTRLTGNILLHLRASPDATEDLRTTQLPTSFVQGDRFTEFPFSPLDTRNREQLYVFVEYPNGTPEEPLLLRAEQRGQNAKIVDYTGGTLVRDHQPAPGDLVFQLLKRARRPFGIQGVAVAFLGSISLLIGGIASIAARRGWMRTHWVTPVALSILGAGLPLIFYLPLLIHPTFLGVGDWDMNTTLHAAAERAIIQEQSFPSWNPYLCGGTPLAAFPEAPVFSPFFSTVLLGGAVQGFKINILLHGALGFLGMLLWLRKGWKLSWPAAFLGAAVVVFSSFFGLHLAAGHSRKVAAAWIPWILFFFQRAVARDVTQSPDGESTRPGRAVRFAAPAAGFLALMFLDGSVYLSFYTAAFVALVGTLASIIERRWRPIAVSVLILVLGTFLAGVHLVPTAISQATLQTTLKNETSPLPANALWSVFLDPDQRDDAQKFEGQTQPWFEYGAYVGLGPILLAALGLLAGRRAVLPWAGAGLFFLLVPLSSRLQQWTEVIPLLGDLRNPQRMLGMLTIVIGLLAALGFERLMRWLLGSTHPSSAENAPLHRAVHVALCVLTTIMIGHLIFMNTDSFSNTFTISPPAEENAPFRQGWARSRQVGAKDSFAFTMENTLRNRGSINRCSVASVRPVGTLRIPTSKPGEEVAADFQDAPYLGEAFLLDGQGTVTVEEYATNRVRVRYDTATPAMLALNENFHLGWRVAHNTADADQSATTPADDVRGLVTTPLPQGSGSVTFSYTMPGLGAGIFMTALGIAASLCIWRGVSLRRT